MGLFSRFFGRMSNDFHKIICYINKNTEENNIHLCQSLEGCQSKVGQKTMFFNFFKIRIKFKIYSCVCMYHMHEEARRRCWVLKLELQFHSYEP